MVRGRPVTSPSSHLPLKFMRGGQACERDLGAMFVGAGVRLRTPKSGATNMKASMAWPPLESRAAHREIGYYHPVGLLMPTMAQHRFSAAPRPYCAESGRSRQNQAWAADCLAGAMCGAAAGDWRSTDWSNAKFCHTQAADLQFYDHTEGPWSDEEDYATMAVVAWHVASQMPK